MPPRAAGLVLVSVPSRARMVPHGAPHASLLGSVTLISGDEEALAPMRELRATFIVDSLADFEAHLRSHGGTILQPPTPTPAGRNMVARDVEGTVFEFVEPSAT
jgi:hypothetical protein